MNNDFFQVQREQSMIKARIVTKYFATWASIILNTLKKNPRSTQRMAYVDLFAGPGKYDDQSKSTPILVLEVILSNPDLSSRMVTLFNDKKIDNIESLKTVITQLPGIENLKYKPLFYNIEVGDEVAKMFSSRKTVPAFFFVDPWGYKGLSLKLVSSIIKSWGCDCVLFFNYNRVNMGVNNDAVKPHMISLFGEERFNKLRRKLSETQSADKREEIVVHELCDALRQSGSKYVLPFCFKSDSGTRTSHYLIFLSKKFLAYDKMKEIMAKESSDTKAEVPSFEYNPLDLFYKQVTIFDLSSSPLDGLKSELLEKYVGQEIDFLQLYKEHSVNRPFIKKNYKDVLRNMYDEGLISAIDPETNKLPRKGTFSDKMRITFGGVI
ncbi:MAG: three-Cys-motif partner protein TcmP [Saccharofermentanales bacterium]|jgi:three-Cys-motif partner protein